MKDTVKYLLFVGLGFWSAMTIISHIKNPTDIYNTSSIFIIVGLFWLSTINMRD